MKQFAKQQWDRFDFLSKKCYVNRTRLNSGLIRMELVDDLHSWDRAFLALKEAVQTERMHNPNFGRELHKLDEETSHRYDINGWLTNYLRILEDYGRVEQLQGICENIIEYFDWKEISPDGFRHQIVEIMTKQERFEECLAFCEGWHKNEPDNLCAVGNLVYARVGVSDLNGAEKLISRYFDEDLEMDLESNTLFFAAELVYILTGQTKKAHDVHEMIQNYLDMTYAELDRINESLGIPKDDVYDDSRTVPFLRMISLRE